uniref:NADH-ubiquinone oxidoreductase chain 6 n=1 Tax=Taeniopygia guttata TaxID=59729 RepID=H0ZIL3_TAEGU
MTYFVLFLGLCFVLGVLAVASNPSPYSEEVGLVLASVAGCGWLLSLGVSFMSLVLFMVYLGGMSMDYVYTLSLVADPFQTLGGICCYGVGVVLVLGEVY